MVAPRDAPVRAAIRFSRGVHAELATSSAIAEIDVSVSMGSLAQKSAIDQG